MLKLKACPRCRGDMHTNRDMHGAYTHCLQCGYMRDLVDDRSGLKSLLEFVKDRKSAA